MSIRSLQTTCCIAGGGPAGMMLGYLLARRGVAVTVLEKHNDFFRDFRGDTVHPSTLELIYELGLLEEFLKLPHQQVTSVNGRIGDFEFQAANFRHVSTHCKFVALMPQWNFLDFLATRAKNFSGFDLRMQHEAIGLIWDGARIAGVEVRTPDGPLQIHADLVVGCDGRHSIIRRAARLETIETGVPIDVLWFRLSRRENDPDELFGNINYGKVLILINRGDYFQAGLIVPKNSLEALKRRGLAALRQELSRIAPYLGERVEELSEWDQVKLLSVQINRLRRWHRPGLLCIGDAAHAMSPAGGVGINLAIQDAVAAANRLANPLRENRLRDAAVADVQRRREFPTRVTQFMQINAHKLFEQIFKHPGAAKAPWQLKLAVAVPGVPDLLGRAVGVGVRPEHVANSRPGKRRALALAGLAATALTLSIVIRKATGESRGFAKS